MYPTARRIVFNSTAPHDPGPPWRPHGNRVSNNVVSHSGRSDLALARGVGPGNCFVRNAAATSLPRGVNAFRCASTSPGDARVAAELTAGARKMFDATMRRRQPPPYTAMPTPPTQPSMP